MKPATKVVGGLSAGLIGAAALFSALAPGECPRTAACLSWTPPATFIDGSAITAPITYNVYRGPTADAAGLTRVATTNATSIVIPNSTQQTQTFYFAVTASVNGVESSLSNSAYKLLRAPGPTDGRIEGPSDGAIE